MISTNQEEWKSIVGFTNYQVSNLGRVRSYNKNKCIILKPRKHDKSKKNTYLRVLLTNDNIVKNKRIHRLVAEAFILNPYNKQEVNHINGIASDNRLINLEWVTRRENMMHKSIISGKNKYNLPMYVSKTKTNRFKVRVKALKIERSFKELKDAKSFASQFYTYKSQNLILEPHGGY